MEKTVAKPKEFWTPPVPGWSWAVKAGPGKMVFVSGQAAYDRQGNVMYPGDLLRQTPVVMENIRILLAELGATLDDVVRVNTFYVSSGSPEDYEEFTRIRLSYFKDPRPSARAIPVPALFQPGVMVEIDVIAMVDE